MAIRKCSPSQIQNPDSLTHAETELEEEGQQSAFRGHVWFYSFVSSPHWLPLVTVSERLHDCCRAYSCLLDVVMAMAMRPHKQSPFQSSVWSIYEIHSHGVRVRMIRYTNPGSFTSSTSVSLAEEKKWKKKCIDMISLPKYVDCEGGDTEDGADYRFVGLKPQANIKAPNSLWFKTWIGNISPLVNLTGKKWSHCSIAPESLRFCKAHSDTTNQSRASEHSREAQLFSFSHNFMALAAENSM